MVRRFQRLRHSVFVDSGRFATKCVYCSIPGMGPDVQVDIMVGSVRVWVDHGVGDD